MDLKKAPGLIAGRQTLEQMADFDAYHCYAVYAWNVLNSQASALKMLETASILWSENKPAMSDICCSIAMASARRLVSLALLPCPHQARCETINGATDPPISALSPPLTPFYRAHTSSTQKRTADCPRYLTFPRV